MGAGCSCCCSSAGSGCGCSQVANHGSQTCGQVASGYSDSRLKHGKTTTNQNTSKKGKLQFFRKIKLFKVQGLKFRILFFNY